MFRTVGNAATRGAVEAIIAAEIDELGARRRSFQDAADAELERLAALQRATDLIGMRPTELAKRADVSRQTLINLRARKGPDHRQWPIDLQVLLALGVGGAQSAAQLEGVLARGPIRAHEVQMAVERLIDEGLIGLAGHMVEGETAPIDYLRLDARGIEDLPRRLRNAALPPSREWTAYVRSSAAEANAIAAAGERALGQHGVGVVPAGTVSGMEGPEVAFLIEAADRRDAEVAAAARFRDLRERAGMVPRAEPVVVTMLIPPGV